MQQDNKKVQKRKDTIPPDSNQKNAEGENVAAAQDEALSDIEQDPDFSLHSPNDDLDEGETARLGEDKTDLV